MLLIGFSPIVMAKQIKLLLWDTVDEPKVIPIVEGIIAKYEAENPNVKIVRESYGFKEMKTLIKTALGSGTGPDIMQYGSGAGFMGPLLEANLLLPLDKYVSKYGWRDSIYPWTWDSNTFDGQVFGIGHELEMIGVYYNKDIFKKLGLKVPRTYDEFLAVAQKTKDAGYIPLAFANGPGWPAYHLFSSYANILAGKERIEAMLADKIPWTHHSIVQAIQMAFVDLNEAGYFIPSSNAVDYGEGNALFYTGQAAMHHTGMWLYGSILDNSDFEVGFFAFPPIFNMPSLPPGGLGSSLMLSSATKHPDEAAAFLDVYFSREVAKIWIEDALIIPPLNIDTSRFKLEKLFQGFAQTIREASTGSGGLGYNIDVLTPPEYNTAMKEGFQAVMNGQRTPTEQAKALQVGWDSWYKK